MEREKAGILEKSSRYLAAAETGAAGVLLFFNYLGSATLTAAIAVLNWGIAEWLKNKRLTTPQP